MDGAHIEKRSRRRVLQTAVAIGVASVAGSGSGAAASDSDERESRVGVAAMGGDPANFEVDRVETNAPVEGGQPLEITVELTNRGAYMREKELTVEVDGLLTDSVHVVLVGGGSSTETFSVDTTPADVGEHVVTAYTEDDAAEESVSVLAPTSFDVSVLELPSSVVAGEEIVATVEVANTGEVEGVESVAFEVGAIGSDSVTVLLDGGDETMETFSVDTTPADVGEHVVTVSAEDDETTETVTVTAEEDDDPPAGEDEESPADEDDDRPADEGDGRPAEGDDDRSADEGPDAERMPGFGIGGAVAGLGGVVHLLSRGLSGGDGDDG